MLVIGLLALCVIVASTVWLGERAQGIAQQVIQTRDVKALAVDLRTALLTAESSQRGFLYTGNEIYLAPYAQGKMRAGSNIQNLPDALKDFPEFTPALQRLKENVDAKVLEMDQSIALKRDRQDEQAFELLRSNRGKQLMDEANVFLTGIQLATDRRIADLVAEQSENALGLRLVSIVGGMMIIGVVGLACFLVYRYTHELYTAREALAQSNDRLEQRVNLRTRELAEANDEMREARDRAQLLLAEVNHRVANSLTLVSSLVGLQARSLDNEQTRSALAETQARVHAVAMVHRRLYDSADVREVDLDEYLAGLLDQFSTTVGSADGISVRYEFESLKLPTDASINLGVVVTEWVMNAIKYAYPDRKGEIRVILARQDDEFGVLRVEDDGVGRDDKQPAKGTGVGSRIVNAMAASMGATIEYRSRGPGTSANLAFPLHRA